MIELAINSEAFYSTSYYIVKISGHRELAKKWLKKGVLQIIAE